MTNENNQYSHKFSLNIVLEISEHLIKDPLSVIRESISNGLDQQTEQARIEIFTHSGVNNDLIIEDWGTGIEDLDKFMYIGPGYKIARGIKSSYDEPDKRLIGNKGWGKLGFLKLSGSMETSSDNEMITQPTVEFWSHKAADPTIEDDVSIGYKVVMKREGFGNPKPKPMNSTQALSHPGCKVVIKDPKYHLLPSETKIIKYISEVFAIRILEGARIVFNGVPIQSPEGFHLPDKLFQLNDGSWICGDFNKAEKAESRNVGFTIKGILVERFSFEHKCSGYIDDWMCIPTSSRESIEEDLRFREIMQKLTEYLDEHFEKQNPIEHKPISKNKDKKEMVIGLLRYQNEELSGNYSDHGVDGEITKGQAIKNKWIPIRDIDLTTDTGDQDGPIIKKTRGGKVDSENPIHRGGTNGGKPGVKPGTHEGMIQETGQDIRNVRGLIIPDLTFIEGHAGLDKPVSDMPKPTQVLVNTSWPQALRAWNAKGSDWKYLFAPIAAQAVINFGIKQKQYHDVTAEKWQELYADYIRKALSSGR